jgi:hypothetical protein
MLRDGYDRSKGTRRLAPGAIFRDPFVVEAARVPAPGEDGLFGPAVAGGDDLEQPDLGVVLVFLQSKNRVGILKEGGGISSSTTQ